MRVKGDGTVFQVKLNSRVVPIKHVDDMDKAIVEMCKSYGRAKQQRERKKKLGKVEKPRVTTTHKEKIASYSEQLETLLEIEKDLAEQIKQAAKNAEPKEQQITQARRDLEQELARTESLTTQIDQAKKDWRQRNAKRLF